MSRPWLDGVAVIVDNTGVPLANGTVEFFVSPGSTEAEVYDGPDLSTSLGVSITLDATGRLQDAVWFDPTVVYKAVIKKSVANGGAEVRTIDPVSSEETTFLALGFKNRLINGGFAINIEMPASNADDTYAHDGWNVLTQSSAIAVTTLTDPASGSPFGMRLTQSNATPQRIGAFQIIYSGSSKDLRAAAATLSGLTRMSTAGNLRACVLEWIGTANAVTSDVVNNWDSASYTAGGFFISSNINVLAVGELTVAAATITALEELTATIGAAANNIIIGVWTEAKVAQNVTLDLFNMQFEKGASATTFEVRPEAIEMLLCAPFCQTSFPAGTAPAQNAGATHAHVFRLGKGASTAQYGGSVPFAVPFWTIPSGTLYNPAAANAQARCLVTSTDCTGTSVASETGRKAFNFNLTSPAGSAQGDSCALHWLFKARL